MIISLHKIRNLLSFLILLLFTHQSLADGLTTKSMLVSIALPVIGGVVSFTMDDVEGLKELGMGCLVTAQVTVLLKNSVQRERPNGSDNMSFPSGHASSAFLGASYLHHRYGIVWGVPMYAIAAVIGLQRVNVKDHYWSDVIAGAAIGYAAGALFTVRYPGVWLEPDVDLTNKSYGVKFKANFD